MEGISIWQVIVILIALSMAILIPLLLFGPIAKKAGYSKWWSLIMIVPIVNILALWIFAFIKWPAEDLHV